LRRCGWPAVAAAATAAAVVTPTRALRCTNMYAENFDPSCRAHPAPTTNDSSACEGEPQRNVAVGVSVTDADFEFRWAIDDSMMSVCTTVNTTICVAPWLYS
jgi:hypothetical protein